MLKHLHKVILHCFRCKTTITTTERFSDYTKSALNDVNLAKQLFYGKKQENEDERGKLFKELTELKETCQLYSINGISTG